MQQNHTELTSTVALPHLASRATALSPQHAEAHAETHVAPSMGGGHFSPPTTAVRTTVLPKIEGDGGGVRLSLETQHRYQPTKVLGQGGMGEVVLVRDHDIARPVALKRLLPEMKEPAILARFVDEIRTVGRLEHPNIVPIHDVGVDAEGRYFFVMKYVEGETLETIIEKLTAGDPEYVSKYTPEIRIQLFLGLLHALEYAHSNGVVHRDIKPANVMVGRFGEVVLMDWGIAKPLKQERDPHSAIKGVVSGDGERARMYATQIGDRIGTPAYMSPEQARGENHKIDARSDLYSAVVLFHELIGLSHYLGEQTSLDGLLGAVIAKEFGFMQALTMKYPLGLPPAELIHIVVKGLAKAPEDRFQSAAELVDTLNTVLDGRVAVQCHITFTKRVFRQLGRFVDKAPFTSFFALLTMVGLIGFSLFTLVRMALPH